MKITLIGGAGFIGTNLCKLLMEKEFSFEIIDIKKSKKFGRYSKYGDIREKESLKKAITGNIIINLAAVHRDDVKDKNDYYETNVDGCKNLVEVCELKGIKKIIFTSSVAVYGNGALHTPMESEKLAKISPANHYGKSKFLAEQILRDWNKLAGRSLAIVRPTVVFGKGNRGNVYNLFRQVASGYFIMIGSGKNKKSIAYVENLAAFLLECVRTNKKFHLSNYVDSPNLDMNSLVKIVRKKLKNKDNVGLRLPFLAGLLLGYFADAISVIVRKRLPISSLRVKKFCSSSVFANDSKGLESFSAPVSLNEAIETTLISEFIEKNPSQEIFFTE